ncbi:tyrosine-type recombinase/integrase [Paractinoplanes rishiriensis]|uniref:DMT family permease n=1 Tax=Paractinoplanes rishiriensis TaxID=1050105 RepID=A0A919MWC2_9ACTN|nr:site-specific integrase [Actinoplanes rishiriensis]GIF02337.1 DMT family permease [Actinoplanes rishiriensis]
MAYAEKRGNLWRARWRGPDGTLESQPGFQSRKAAEEYGRDKESEIRGNRYVDPRSGKITLIEWVNLWYPSLDLEPTTMNNYRYMIEVHILPEYGSEALGSLTAEEIAKWEKRLVATGLSRRTAHDIRSTLATVLADAVPRYIQTNPAVRKRGKGRKGQRRIERIEKQEKVWASPLEALMLAERAAILSGEETDFTMNVTIAYTGARWSEAIGLPPECVRPGQIDIHWKLYELNGRFYRGRPKDGSMRTVDIPPFLYRLLVRLISPRAKKCTCQVAPHESGDIPWCAGGEFVFLGPRGGHFRRSNYSERIIRPAADGWHPARAGRNPRPRMPVLVDASGPMPGKPLPAWPAVPPGDLAYTSPTGRGRARIPDETPLASWLPILPGLTPHGWRHGHETWMDEAAIPYVLQSDRMGHVVPGMRGVYSHISGTMRAALVAALQRMWEDSLAARAALSPRSAVQVLDELLAPYREPERERFGWAAPKALPKSDT